MKYNELQLARQKKPTRSGRGISAGRGMTAGRGTKGQGARKSPVRSGFEGGQNPLYARLPKLRGFKSHRQTIETVKTSQLNQVKAAKISNQTLFDAGLVSSPFSSVKLLFDAKIEAKKDVSLQSASQAAVDSLNQAGGSFSSVARVGQPAKKPAESAK